MTRAPSAFAIALFFLLSAVEVHAAAARPADKGPSLLRTGRYDEALRICRARLARAPDDTAATLLCARAEELTGRY
ncbi:MAG TPA: tetratricopeptide repeat protein, partial [Polyangia bacterium]